MGERGSRSSAKPPTCSLGAYIRWHRERAGMTQKEAHIAAAVSSATWRNIETDAPHQTPKRETVTRIARAVGANMDVALWLAGHGPKPPRASAGSLAERVSVANAIRADPALTSRAAGVLLDMYDLLTAPVAPESTDIDTD